jgi:hypothetical protein
MRRLINFILRKLKLTKFEQYIKKHNKYGKTGNDDFNWEFYNLHYRAEIENLEKEFTTLLSVGDYTLTGGGLKQTNERKKPLHPNWRLLYETVLELKPTIVFEMGVGNGMHLYNLNILNNSLELRGIDRSADQIRFLKEYTRQNAIYSNIVLKDATVEFEPSFHKVADVSYTQAVIMHIQSGDNHKKALANLFKTARNQVVLMENWLRHEFLSDIQALHASGETGWDNIYFYYKNSPEINEQPHLVVVSRTPLSMEKYYLLDSYDIMTAPMLNLK